MSPRRLVLVRHGQTSSNVINSLDSKPPGPPLTEEGRRQASAVAQVLSSEPVVAVYASVAVRAMQTAAAIAAVHGLAVEILEGVQEVYVGELDSRNDDEALRTFFAVFDSWTAGGDLDIPMPGGESASQVLCRYLGAVRVISERHPDGTVVLVSHGAAIRLASFALADNIASDLAGTHLLANAATVVLETDLGAPTGWRCLEWGGIALS
ncbi:MAG: histidine phosphatase family protein [Kutzneria sp.]|nr:histidine phosphatase family protein [Kutzneria sp.]MBV9844968.1 histidine phosphatase family protein [Kutzneria sp.]